MDLIRVRVPPETMDQMPHSDAAEVVVDGISAMKARQLGHENGEDNAAHQRALVFCDDLLVAHDMEGHQPRPIDCTGGLGPGFS